jgi:hypothetical protein
MHIMIQIHCQHDARARDVQSMMSLLRPVDVRAQTLLLLPQRLLLLPPDALAAHDHHDRLVARLFAIRRAARRLLLPPALQRPEFLPALASSRYRRHPLLVVRLCLLAWTEYVALRYERRRVVVVCAAGRRGSLFGGFEGCELAFGDRPTSAFYGFCRRLYSQVIDQREISGCENLRAKLCVRSSVY